MASDEFSGNYMDKHRDAKSTTDLFPGQLHDIRRPAEGVVELISDNQVLLRIQFLEAGILRFRYSVEGRFEDDFSYAIDPNYRPATPDFEFVEFGDGVALRTDRLSVRITRQGLRVTITDTQTGRILCQDEKGFHWEDNREFGGEVVKMSKTCQPGEHFYGLGDKSCDLNLRGKRFDLWGSDTYAYGPNTDPLYKNIPFYIGLCRGLAYGIFFDNTFRSSFDFGQERPSVTSFFAQGGEMNYYFIHGPSPMDVIRSYTNLTGKADMPPLWALGYHQCKWSYYPEAVVRTLAKNFRDNKVPCDAIYLDIDYMDGYRCFTWDVERFPKPKQMVADLEKDGFKTVAIIDPGLKIDPDYSVWVEGLEKGYYCRRQDGTFFKGSVWPGLCHFPDFTHPEVRHWWADQFEGLIGDTGIRGIWNDMNEPAVFEDGTFPLNVRHDYDGHPCSHRKAHNVYGMQMVRATREGLKRFGNGRRAFSITRSAYAGTQRFACAWTGDNVASWEHLLLANLQCQRLATSGMSFVGSDVGGFIEDPTPELYERWVQLAVFHPFFRTHSSGDRKDQEPWSYGPDTLNVVRTAIELRYQLLPVIYTTFWQYVKDGTPMLRSLPLVAFDDPDAYWRSAEFFFGDHMYVVPIPKEGETGRFLYLPNGQWFSYWDDKAPKAVRQDIWVDGANDRSIIFVRAGCVLPHWPIQQHVGEIADPEPTLHIWWKDGAEKSQWYEDNGDGEEWRDGTFRESNFTVEGTKGTLKLTREWNGHWQPRYGTIHLILRSLFNDAKTLTVQVDGQPVEAQRNENGQYCLDVAPDFRTLEASWTFVEPPAPAPPVPASAPASTEAALPN